MAESLEPSDIIVAGGCGFIGSNFVRWFEPCDPCRPSGPYSSVKVSSGLLVRAWTRTYGDWVTISNCSNSYGPDERDNLPVFRVILERMGKDPGDFDRVSDRPGCGRRYAIDTTKLETELGWRPVHTGFASGLDQTVARCRDHEGWWRPAKEATEAKYAKQGR